MPRALFDAGAGHRDHAGGQSRPAWRPARLAAFRAGRGEPGVAGRAEPGSTRRCAMLGRQHSARPGDRGAGDWRGGCFPRVSFDLIYARPGQALAAWRAELRAGAGARRRSSVALPADHRARHGVRGAAPRAARSCCRTRMTRPRCMTRRPRKPRGFGLAGLRGVQLRRARARRAGTTSPIGATATTPASGPARMGGSAWTARCSPRAAIARRSPGRSGWSATATAAPTEETGRAARIARARCC